MNPGAPAVGLLLTTWAEEGTRLAAVRQAVFVVEQGIPPALEWDAEDALSLHVLAVDGDGEPVGCARLLPDAHIGRVAVLAAWRGRGVGSTMIAALVDAAGRRGDREVLLNAQVQALPFYERLGFAPVGETFDEAGIPHRAMRRAIGC